MLPEVGFALGTEAPGAWLSAPPAFGWPLFGTAQWSKKKDLTDPDSAQLRCRKR